MEVLGRNFADSESPSHFSQIRSVHILLSKGILKNSAIPVHNLCYNHGSASTWMVQLFRNKLTFLKLTIKWNIFKHKWDWSVWLSWSWALKWNISEKWEKQSLTSKTSLGQQWCCFIQCKCLMWIALKKESYLKGKERRRKKKEGSDRVK